MARRIFINGMGRIGRLFLRKTFETNDAIQVVGVNDPYMTSEKLAYLLKHDTVYGDFKGDVKYKDGYLVINDKQINFYSTSEIASLPLGEYTVDMIIDCSGAFRRNPTQFSGPAIAAGAKVAAISYPSTSTIPIYVYGINAYAEIQLNSDVQLLSFGSCSLNAAAVLLKAVNKTAGVESAFIEVVRSYTGDQNLCDNVVGDISFERGRAAAQNIVPTHTSAANYIGLISPELNGRVLGTALRTPTIVGGAINASIVMPKSFTKDEINAMMKAEASDTLAYSEERLVSSDVVSNDSIPTFLASQTLSLGNVCNVTLLYDNEMGFVNQMIKLILNCNLFVNGSQIW